MSTWLDRIAADLMHLDADLRVTLRQVAHGRTPDRSAGWNRIWLRPVEVRTLLRGVMPATIAVTRLREPHARLVAALGQLHAQMAALNEAGRPLDDALTAACAAIDELRRWVGVARWMTATRRAGVRWPVPAEIARPAVTDLMRLQTAPGRERTPNPPAFAADADRRDGMRWLEERRRATAQLELALEPASSAEVIDLRQLRLQLEEERRDAA